MKPVGVSVGVTVGSSKVGDRLGVAHTYTVEGENSHRV